MEMIIYDLNINTVCVLICTDNFSIIKNAWPFSQKIWDSGDPLPSLREKVPNLSIYLNYGIHYLIFVYQALTSSSSAEFKITI